MFSQATLPLTDLTLNLLWVSLAISEPVNSMSSQQTDLASLPQNLMASAEVMCDSS
jgi:hypothetical protein